jgi:uncharacterized membrane protein HdeD (DUF308 family)
MTTVTADTVEVSFFRGVGRLWWVFLITGSLWVILSLVVLTVDPTSVTVIAFLTGVVILLAGLAEIAMTFLAPGWRWLHALLAILFIAGGVASFIHPLQTFGILAILIGWWLVVKGTVDIVESVAGRDVVELWGLVLALGIGQVLIGIWAIGSPVRSAWLLILWVGLGALARGITEIFMAFRLKELEA